MNPFGLVIIGIGVLLIILGVKGSYSSVETVITGKPHSPPSGGTSGTGPNQPIMQHPALMTTPSHAAVGL